MPAPHRAKFSRVAVEGNLRARLENLERWLLRDYRYHIDLSDPRANPLKGGMPPQQVLLIGQWISTKELLDDIIRDMVYA